MRSSLKPTYRTLLRNNPLKTKAKLNILYNYKNLLEENKRESQRILKKEGR